MPDQPPPGGSAVPPSAVPPSAVPLVPAGLRLRPDQGLRSLDGGQVLLGGSPYRLLRLGPAGARQVAAWWQG
ncbi:MAG: hypothetical protein ACRDNF_04225, partial [Streptosporangiaceae bacterium]